MEKAFNDLNKVVNKIVLHKEVWQEQGETVLNFYSTTQETIETTLEKTENLI